MSGYPEHDKLSAVKDEAQAIGEFLDWLSTNGVSRMRFDDFAWRPDCRTIEQLLAAYFDIDLDKLEKEKRDMLDELRSRNNT